MCCHWQPGHEPKYWHLGMAVIGDEGAILKISLSAGSYRRRKLFGGQIVNL